jgi:hypothetical protein
MCATRAKGVAVITPRFDARKRFGVHDDGTLPVRRVSRFPARARL